jgi:polysaccharide biosynthesis transport protein
MNQEVMLMDEGSNREELNLLNYWLLLRKHGKPILGLAFVVTLLVALVVFQITPVYRSTALLLIDNSKSKTLSLADLYDIQGSAGQEVFNSQIQILKSRPITELVVKKLALNTHPAFNLPKQSGWLELVFGKTPIPQGTPAEVEAQQFERTLGMFSSKLTVEPIAKSQIVKISFDSTDKELAAQVANAVAEAYIENDLEARSKMTQRANMWLTERMDGLRKALGESEAALQQYREQENIIDNKGVVLSGSGKQLEEISTNLISARQRLAEAEGVYNQVKDIHEDTFESMESLPAVLKNAAVRQTREVESNAALKLSELQSRYTAMHPKVIAAQSELNSAHEAVNREVKAVVKGITNEYALAKANVAANSRALGQVKSDIQNLTRKEFKLSVLMREVESNKQLYDVFVNRSKETDAASNLQSTAGRIIDPAVIETAPLKPKKMQTIGIALILSLLMGMALVFVSDYLDNTLHTVEDVERHLGVETLGTLPILPTGGSKPGGSSRMYREDPNSVFSEAVRTLRTAVLLSAIDEPHRVVMVTSTLPGEGKSTISVNLAFALGQMKKVLLIEGDLRRPSMAAAMVGMEGVRGLIDYLADGVNLKSCIHNTESANVFVMPAGKRFNAPLELLSSQRFGDTIAKLKELFDVVIIDCPPLKPVSDSLVISRYANAVLYVVKAETTPHQLAGAAIERLLNIQAPLLGVVLNQVDYKKADQYGQYEYVYGQVQKSGSRTFLGIKI